MASAARRGTAAATAVKAQVFAVNFAPTISLNGGGDNAGASLVENSAAVTTVTAIDTDPGAVLAFSIVGGDDAARFKINATTGALSFIVAPSFEAPAERDGNDTRVKAVSSIVQPSRERDRHLTWSTTATRCSIRCTTSAAIPTCSTPASNALDHYNTFGWHEGRDPNAFFDTSGYLAVNKDVAAAGVNPLDHYHNSGWQRGTRSVRRASTRRSTCIRNPDVAAAGIDPLAHYLAVRHAPKAARPMRRSGRHRERLRRAVLPVPQSGRGGGRRRSAVPLQRRRLAGGAQSERVVRHRRLSLALHRRRGGRHQSARTTTRRSAGRKAAIRRPASTRSAIWRRTRTSRRPASIRSTTSCSSASTRAGRRSMTGCSIEVHV